MSTSPAGETTLTLLATSILPLDLQQFRFLAKVNLVLGKSEGRENWPSLATASKRLQRARLLRRVGRQTLKPRSSRRDGTFGRLGGGGAPSKKLRRLR